MAFVTSADIDKLGPDMHTVIIPVKYLGELKKDIGRFRDTENLNGFQKGSRMRSMF